MFCGTVLLQQQIFSALLNLRSQRCLVHSQSSVTSRYIHSFDAALITAADAVAGYIDRLMKGTIPSKANQRLPRRERERALEELFG